MCLIITLTELKLFTVCTERIRSPYTEHAASGLHNPTPLEGEVRFIYAQDQQMSENPRMVAECLLTRSMLIKVYYHFMVCTCACTIVFTVSQFHADVYLAYLVFQLA